MFEIVDDGCMDEGRRRTPDHGYPISSLMSLDSSGELIKHTLTEIINQRTNGPVKAHLTSWPTISTTRGPVVM